MAISLEEELACDPKLSATEVVEMLRRHRPLPDERYYDINIEWRQFWLRDMHKRRMPWWDDFFSSWTLSPWPLIGHYPLSDPWSNSRRTLRQRVLTWLLDSNRDRSLLWITDPFLVDELPAAVHSLTSITQEIRRLGAVVYDSRRFFSANGLILDILWQLMQKYPPYRRLVLMEVVDDPMILKKRLRTIFRKLIVEPWITLATTHSFYLENPPLIAMIFRWGCEGDKITELMELVVEHSKLRLSSPLLWLVSSHPEDSALTRAFSETSVWAAYEPLSSNDAEAIKDVSHFLRNKLRGVQSRRSGFFSVDEVWPTEEQVTCLTTSISGVYSFARTTLCFIQGGDPKRRLEICLACMAGSPIPSNADPFQAHHYFLQRLLVSVAPDAIPLLCLPRHFQSRIRESAHVLGISQNRCYSSIENLRCFLAIYLPKHARVAQLRVLDEGFNFFREVGTWRRYNGSAPFSSAFASARLRTLQGFLRILCCPSVSNLLETMTWSPSTPHRDFTTIYSLRSQEAYHFQSWRMEEECHHLRSFDFRSFVGRGISFDTLHSMVCRLHELFGDCARTEPLTVLDEEFISKCKTVAIPKNFMQPTYEKGGVVEYALLGYGDQTVLVLWTWKVEHVGDSYSFKGSSVVVYSLDLLDDL